MRKEIETIVKEVGRIILGKDQEIRLVLTCLLAKGHLLIEDIPGVGKTTLAQTLAMVLGLNFSRVQCTSDLLPADIVGISIFDKEEQGFRFHPGPLFDQMVLADELNRATPRTQSALLEAMEERQVSVDGVTHRLPEPFFVIATQNQRYHVGTFPLPESQLDRFLMRLQLGYPDYKSERQLLTGEARLEMVRKLKPLLQVATLKQMQEEVTKIHAADAILDYVQDIIAASRGNPEKYLGLSPRGGISLLRAAQAWALCEDREMVLPEDIQRVAGSVLEHRLNPEGSKVKSSGYLAAEQLMKSVPLNS
ncbi:MAG: MoxR family ATPase [Candidatus Aminicenantes bacterium]|nr:MoxR family ATPase [Candidatus Aminicenantes bacterium]